MWNECKVLAPSLTSRKPAFVYLYSMIVTLSLCIEDSHSMKLKLNGMRS